MSNVNFKILLNFLEELQSDLMEYDGIKRCNIRISSVENFQRIEASSNFYFDNIEFTYDSNVKDLKLSTVGKDGIYKLQCLYFYFNNVERLYMEHNGFRIVLKNGSDLNFKCTKLPRGV